METQELREIINKGASTGREVRKAQAILLLDQETDFETIRSITAYERRRIFQLRSEYLEHGISTIKDKREGKPKELLTKKQREEIVLTIKTRRPCELSTYRQNYEHWTTGVLGEYIKRTYKVQYKSKTSHYLLFRQAKFTYHKPGRVYHQRDEQEVEQWKTQVQPRLEQLWGEPGTVILAEDEMVLTTQTTVQKIWLPQGEYPRIEVSNQSRQRRNIYGFLNITTGTQHAFKTMKQNMVVTREILEKIRSIYPKQKIAIFWDSAGWHKGSAVRECIERDGNIEVIHFPRYAPEENPQEHVGRVDAPMLHTTSLLKTLTRQPTISCDF